MAKIFRFSGVALKHLRMYTRGLIASYGFDEQRAADTNTQGELIGQIVDQVTTPLTGLEYKGTKPAVATAILNELTDFARLVGEEHEGVAIWCIKGIVVIKGASTGAALLPPVTMSVNFQGSAFQSDTDQVAIDGRMALAVEAQALFQARVDATPWFKTMVLSHIKDVNDWTVEVANSSITIVN